MDSVTRAPISGAIVSIRPTGESVLVQAGVATNGTLIIPRQNDDKMIEFYVEADGYRGRSKLVNIVEERGEAEILLDQTARQIKGVVIAPNGQPVADAKIAITRPESGLLLRREGRHELWELSNFHMRSAENGGFALTAEGGSESLTVVHALGCVSAPLAGWTNRA